MNFLLSLVNASDRSAVQETNNEKIDTSLAFMITPSLELTGLPTTLYGPPAAGHRVKGEIWIDKLGAIFRCTVAGTPGTWVQYHPAIVAAEPTSPPTLPSGYLIKLSDDWHEEYWDGAAWQNV